MQSQLRARYLADSTISTNCGTRVDWNIRPQGKALPAVTIELARDVRDQHMGGLQTTRGTLIQTDVWAEDASTAATIREAIVALLAVRAVQGGVTFLGSADIDVSNTIEITDNGPVHREIIRSTVWHTVIPE